MPANDRLGLLALNRFGFGSRADGDLAAASRDPRGFLLAELAGPDATLLGGPDLPSTPVAIQQFYADQDAKKAARDAAAKAAAAAMPMNGAGDTHPAEGAAKTAPPTASPPVQPAPPAPSPEQVIFRAEALARIRRAATARAGFAERLVAFWSNHFCVSVAKGGFLRVAAGAFEREAIRPHVLGRFEDMLGAVESHPAMLAYLDNGQSAGADSRAGQRPGRGLNENLGREILELHTLGVAGGYTQTDVTALANIITGWTVSGRDGKLGPPGASIFNADLHQPGPQVLLGRRYGDDGRAQGMAALNDLARHPATTQHLATKLSRHFVADDPSPALVARLAAVFTRTDGDLLAVSKALVEAPEAWDASRPKMRDPWQFLLATVRLTGHDPVEPNATLGALSLLGQPLWSPPGPNGFGDNAAVWASPEGVKTRLDIADRIASRIPDGPNPVDLLSAIAGSAASTDTREAIGRAASRRQALALLLMSPEVQRR